MIPVGLSPPAISIHCPSHQLWYFDIKREISSQKYLLKKTKLVVKLCGRPLNAMQARNKFCNDRMMNCLLKSQCSLTIVSWRQLPSDFTTTMSTALESAWAKTNRNISIDKARREVLSKTIRNRDKKNLTQFRVERFYLISNDKDDLR